ncbi:g protein alpha i subunit [Anaeramoeba flamelloides]|uniref:G protein alpha i subunit n=1 Tax=Anaeramoeba flamelloides TaxID=1746091 RepID=A0AAV7YNX3_9EUKA|nr:g protein alpha i subunit [Anaeramoeba flamelloides]
MNPNNFDQRILEDQLEVENKAKLLPLIAGESGKSTMFKHMKIIHCKDSKMKNVKSMTTLSSQTPFSVRPRTLKETDKVEGIRSLLKLNNFIKKEFWKENPKRVWLDRKRTTFFKKVTQFITITWNFFSKISKTKRGKQEKNKKY